LYFVGCLTVDRMSLCVFVRLQLMAVLKYKTKSNQRLLVVTLLMPLASINYDGEKKKLSPL
jgi:hypothetical protein